ncbi:MAG: peptidyl-prolyl cis-trans isomerase [Acidobacteriota bacterium]
MKKRTARLVFLSAFLAAAGLSAGQVIEEIVAIVNDDVITLSQYRQYYDSVYRMYRAQFQGEEFEKQLAKVKPELLNKMITDLLLLQAAKQKQLNVNEWVKAYIENIKKENNIETDQQFRQALLQQGMDYEQFLKEVEENALQQAVIANEVERSIVVDESEVVNYYKLHQSEYIEPEEFKLRAVYLSTELRSPEELQAKKQEVEARVKAGAEFAAVAGELADSPLKENQGDLGYIPKGQLDKVLEQAVVKLKAGEVAAWVEGKNGWYLLKLEEKKESRLKPYDEVKEEIGKKLFGEKRDKKLTEFLKDLRAKNYVKILKPDPLGDQ